MELSTVVMAHPNREAWALELSRELDCQIVWDEIGHPWDTGRRALLAGTGTHVMVIQDDSLISEGLVESVSRAIEYSGEHPIGLYAGTSARVRAALALHPGAWWTGDGPTWGVAVVIPTDHVRDLVRFGDRYRSYSYDQRLWHYYRGKFECWYTVPSLVDHRDEGSLMGKTRRPRKAQVFGSGLDVDWSSSPVQTNKDQLHPIVELGKDGVIKKVRSNTRAHRQLVALGWE